MESLLAEQPLLLSLMLGALAGALIYGWLQTGKKAAAIAGVAVVLLIPLAWIVASHWETDREQIESLIYEIADAVERNDQETALQVIEDAETRSRARMEMQRWTFDTARVNRIRSIDLIEGTYPQQADVDMSVKIAVSGRSGGRTFYRGPRRLILTFEKTEDGWLVTDYQHMPVVGGPDRYSSPAGPVQPNPGPRQ